MNNRKTSIKRENSIAKDIDGRRTPMSGGGKLHKGDVGNYKFLVEDKFTDKDSYSLTLKTLNKIEYEARKVNKVPVLCLGFQSSKRKRNYAIVNSFYTTSDMRQELHHTGEIATKPCGDVIIIKNKKSMLLYESILESSYYHNIRSIVFLVLQFENEGSGVDRYLIMDWGIFLAYMEKFNI